MSYVWQRFGETIEHLIHECSRYEREERSVGNNKAGNRSGGSDGY